MLAGLAEYGSSSEEEGEEGKKAMMDVEEKKEAPGKKKSLLPSADDLFDSIDAPSFMGNNAKRQAEDIANSRPTKISKAGGGGGGGPSSSAPKATTKSTSLLSNHKSPSKHMLPPQVSRPNAKNIVTEDTGAWMSKGSFAKAKAKK